MFTSALFALSFLASAPAMADDFWSPPGDTMCDNPMILCYGPGAILGAGVYGADAMDDAVEENSAEWMFQAIWWLAYYLGPNVPGGDDVDPSDLPGADDPPTPTTPTTPTPPADDDGGDEEEESSMVGFGLADDDLVQRARDILAPLGFMAYTSSSWGTAGQSLLLGWKYEVDTRDDGEFGANLLAEVTWESGSCEYAMTFPVQILAEDGVIYFLSDADEGTYDETCVQRWTGTSGKKGR